MHDIGLDLAWGPRGRTGVAGVDDRGRLVHAETVRTDAEILDRVRALVGDGPCSVGIDAPIVVRNATGSRACERLVGRHFGRFHASCYPSNTANPAFADGGRAIRLVRELGLDVGLGSVAPRRAAEVYPHAALVALFELPSVLEYKNRSHRTLAHRQGELLRLMDLLESLADAAVPLVVGTAPQWSALRGTVERASIKGHLALVEDAIDAVVCAYVVRYARLNPSGVRCLGTTEDGFILTPVSPALAEAIDRPSAT